MSELSALDPTTGTVGLSTGRRVALEPMRARQFFKLLRIITHGAGATLSSFKLDPDEVGFVEKLVTMIVLSIPDAEDETIEFLQSMTAPVGLREGRKLNKQDEERNADLWRAYQQDMDNPDLGDLLTLVETIVWREAADLQALGKRLVAMFSLAKKTGQLSPDRTSTPSPVGNSSAPSPEPSTSSAPSTDGPMTSSPTSLFGGSGRS